jgi:Anti-sigma-28 factor, FlgM
MTALALRYQQGRADTARRRRGRFGRAVHDPPDMDARMDQIRTEIATGRYDIDPDKVADAIVKRLLATRPR